MVSCRPTRGLSDCSFSPSAAFSRRGSSGNSEIDPDLAHHSLTSRRLERPMMHESAAGASQDAQGWVQQRLQRRITLFMGQTIQVAEARRGPNAAVREAARTTTCHRCFTTGAERERVCSESLELRSEVCLRRQCAAAALDGGRMAGRGGCGGGETHTRPASCTACDMVAFLRSKLRTRSQFVRSRWNCVPRFA